MSENGLEERCENSREIAIVRNPPTTGAIKIRNDALLKDSLRSSAPEYLNTFYLIDSELGRVVHCGSRNPYAEVGQIQSEFFNGQVIK